MKPFKNEETQKFCEKIAEIYLTGNKEKANIMFKESVSMMKVARWELIAMSLSSNKGESKCVTITSNWQAVKFQT